MLLRSGGRWKPIPRYRVAALISTLRYDLGHTHVFAPILYIADQARLTFFRCADPRIAAKAVEKLLRCFLSYGIGDPFADLLNNRLRGRAWNHRRKPARKIDIGDTLFLQ